MLSTRRVVGALALLLTLCACGASPAARVVSTQLVDATATTPPTTVDPVAAWHAAETSSFLAGVAATRAAVPGQLRRIMWCEAGRYRSLPAYATNYQAMTHGYDGASGGGQAVSSTWLSWAREIGVDVARWPRAFLAPDFVQDAVLTHGYLTRGTAPWTASAGCWR